MTEVSQEFSGRNRGWASPPCRLFLVYLKLIVKFDDRTRKAEILRSQRSQFQSGRRAWPPLLLRIGRVFSNDRIKFPGTFRRPMFGSSEDRILDRNTILVGRFLCRNALY